MKHWGKYYATALLIGAMMAVAGCAKRPSDSQISEQVQAKFKQDSGLQDKSITVQTSNGVVTLAGSVDNDAERTAAARYASTTPGIKEVVNNLQVAAAAAQPMPEPTAQAAAATSEPPAGSERPSAARLRNAHESSSRRVSRQADSASNAASDSSDQPSAEPVSAETQVADGKPAPSEPAPAPQPPPAPPSPRMLTIESGTTMAIRLVDDIDSETAQQGQTFRATLESPLSAEWDVAIPAGYTVEGHVVEVKSAGKFAGQSELVLSLDKIVVRNKTYEIRTDDYRRKGKSQGTKTAEKVGVGAAIGAIIGGIAGGGKGAGIGAAAGGGVGGAAQAASKPQPVRLASETVLHFTLQAPVTVAQVQQGPGGERPRLETNEN
ncbi:MAG: BON domain-containing protein [Terriglobales bacterium]